MWPWFCIGRSPSANLALFHRLRDFLSSPRRADELLPLSNAAGQATSTARGGRNPRRSRMPGRGSRAADADEAVAPASKPTRTPRPAKEAEAKVTKPATGKGSGRRGRPRLDPAERKTQPYVPTGRPRGRPPKDPSQRKSAAATEKPAKPYVPTGRPRGRPRKHPVAKEEAAKNEPAKAAVPKKRGRPSKAPVEEDDEDEDVDEDEGSPAPVQSDLPDSGDVEVDQDADDDED